MADLATAYVRLVPSLRGAQKQIESELGGIGGKAGEKAGQGLGQGILGNIGEIAGKAAGIFAKVFAAKKVFDFGKASFDAYAEFEQLAGGAEKIFDQLDQAKILEDANGAWLTLNMSANDYLESINMVGATFAQTMGDADGYETAKRGMQAISDFASGTGADLSTLNEKYKLITRSTSSYQSIADQFAGILPQTSKDFLEQAKAAGYLKEGYDELTDVPVAEYQQAVTSMLEKGVADIGMAGNTMHESLTTLSGSMAATKTAWQNLVTELGKPDANIGARISDMLTALLGEGGEGGMLRNVASEIGTIAQNVIGGIGTAIGMGVDWLVANGPSMIGNAMVGLGDAIERGWTAILDFRNEFDLTSALFGEDGSSGAVGAVMGFLGNIGNAIVTNWPYLQGQLEGLWEEAVAFVLQYGPQVVGAIGTILSNVGSWLIANLPTIVGALATGFYSIAEWLTSNGPMIVEMVAGLVGQVRDWLVANGPQILQAVVQVITNVVTAIVTYGPTILTNIATTVGMIVGYIASAATDMLGAAIEFMGGLITGSSQEGEVLREWFANLPQTLLAALGDLSTFLVDAGSQIIQGFWDGLKSKFSEVQDWVSGIGSWIASHKGPKQYDLGLLVQNGEWIMTGLQKGLTDSLPELRSTLALVTGEIAGGIGLPSPSGMDLARSSMSNAVRDVYSASAPMASKAPQVAAAQPVDGSSYAAMQALGADLRNLGIYLDGNLLVGGISTRMDRALVR